MKTSSRVSAFLAYLLPVVGWLFVLLFRRNDRFARFHANQSIVLILAALAVPAIWAISAWLVARIPIIGPMTAAGTFALVVAAVVFFAALWLLGMANALRARPAPLPMVGQWAKNLPF